MPKLKKIFPSIFAQKPTSTLAEGKLETDAAPVDDSSNGNHNSVNSCGRSPVVSEEFNTDAVQIASNVNNNTLDSGNIVPSNTSVLNESTPVSTNVANTMNVNNTQGQVVMQFSNMSQVHFGSVYNISSVQSAEGNDSGNVGKPRLQRRTTTVVAMMQCQNEPNHRMLDTISAHLGEGWKDVMRSLDLSEGQIDQAIIDHQMHGGIKEVIYQLLLQWIRGADDDEATVGRITSLLWDSNHRDCVQRMKLVWKGENTTK